MDVARGGLHEPCTDHPAPTEAKGQGWTQELTLRPLHPMPHPGCLFRGIWHGRAPRSLNPYAASLRKAWKGEAVRVLQPVGSHLPPWPRWALFGSHWAPKDKAATLLFFPVTAAPGLSAAAQAGCRMHRASLFLPRRVAPQACLESGSFLTSPLPQAPSQAPALPEAAPGPPQLWFRARASRGGEGAVATGSFFSAPGSPGTRTSLEAGWQNPCFSSKWRLGRASEEPGVARQGSGGSCEP